MTKRILHVMNDLTLGGGQALVLEFVEHRDRSRFNASVAAIGPGDDISQEIRALDVDVLRLADKRPSMKVVALVRYILSHRIDLVHVHSDLDRKYGQLAAFLTRRPVVAHLHAPWNHRGSMWAQSTTRFGRIRGRITASLRDGLETHTVKRYIAASENVAMFHTGSVKRPIVMAGNGIDVEHFSNPGASKKELRQKLGLDPKATIAVCVARMAEGKGQDTLIRLLSRVPELTLVLVGDGPCTDRLKKLAAEEGVSERAIFAGYHLDISEYLFVSDMFLFASISEARALVVLEAMAAGLPVVQYHLPAFDQIIRNGVNAFEVPQGALDQLARVTQDLVADRDMRDRVGAAAKATVAGNPDYDAATTTKRVEQVYSAILDC